MRKIYCLVSAAAIALGLASCNKEPVETADRQITIVANTESGVDTKTALSGDDQTGYQVLWSEGDRIILDIDGSYPFDINGGVGTTRGTFVGNLPFGSSSAGINCRAYYATDGSYLDSKSYYKPGNVISSAPMVATVSVKNGFVSEANFKNLCGLLRLTLKGNGTIKKIRLIDDAPLYGDIDRIASDGAAVLKSAGLSEYALTHDCGAGVDLSADGTNFYIPMPQGNYDGIKIEITDRLDRTITKTLKAGKILNITRSKITPVSLTVASLDVDPLPDGALSGAFTVNKEGRKVFFSRGNLYWDGDSFELEEEQYNYPNERVDNHIGHFFWNISASESLKEGAYDETYVLFTNNPDYADRANADFVVNGVRGRYRTLTKAEWGYLLDNHQHIHAAAGGVNGLVIAPDGVTLEDDKKSYTSEELKNDNLVFLPAAGYYYFGLPNIYSWKLYSCGVEAYYLSCNPYTGDKASAILFNNDRLWYEGYPLVDMGTCIRLVTAMSDDEPLDSSDIEKPEDGNDYEWE
ncbi:MAG: hypothetical protein KBT08_05500 [Bacteroidales bacterium]|nr:hypothetical protein [Candidatus Cryptobacteroides onthequi]